jgi:hypothetical protein
MRNAELEDVRRAEVTELVEVHPRSPERGAHAVPAIEKAGLCEMPHATSREQPGNAEPRHNVHKRGSRRRRQDDDPLLSVLGTARHRAEAGAEQQSRGDDLQLQRQCRDVPLRRSGVDLLASSGTRSGVTRPDLRAVGSLLRRADHIGTLPAMSGSIVECEEHGARTCAFVCIHLMEWRRAGVLADKQWIVEGPDPDDPEPMAWCLDCEARLEATGEWTDELLADIRLVCDRCFEQYASASDAL